VVEVSVINTAGAGDTFLAGIIVGLVAGLSFREAHELGALTGSFSVTNIHTIHKMMNRDSLRELVHDVMNKYTHNEL